jgi:hypothetical protein
VLVPLENATERIWRFGYSVYPVATYGLLTAISVHKLLGSDQAEVRKLIKDQIDNHFRKSIDPKEPGSFPSLREQELQLMEADKAFLNHYPRSGRVNCWDRRIGHGEYSVPERVNFYASVIPKSGIPADRFRLVGDQSIKSASDFPDIQNIRFCGDKSVDIIDEVQKLLNGKLASMKRHGAAADSFAKISDDVSAIIDTLQRI